MPLLQRIKTEIIHAINYLREETFVATSQSTDLRLCHDEEKIVHAVSADLRIAGESHRITIPASSLLKNPARLHSELIEQFRDHTKTLDDEARTLIEQGTTIEIGLLFADHYAPDNYLSITSEIAKATKQHTKISTEILKALTYLSPKIMKNELKNSAALDPNYFIVRINSTHEAPIHQRSFQFNFSIGCDLVRLSIAPSLISMERWQEQKLNQNHPTYALHENKLYYVTTSPYQFNLIYLKKLGVVELITIGKLFPTDLDIQINAPKKALDLITLITGHSQLKDRWYLNTERCIKEITTFLGNMNLQINGTIKISCGLGYPFTSELSPLEQQNNCFTLITTDEPEPPTNPAEMRITEKHVPSPKSKMQNSPKISPDSTQTDQPRTPTNPHHFFVDAQSLLTEPDEEQIQHHKTPYALRISSV